MSRGKLSPAQIDELVQLRERGWSYPRIKAHFSAQGIQISVGAIGWQCLKEGADAPPGFWNEPAPRRSIPALRSGHLVRPFSEAEDEQLLAFEAQGLNYTEIGRRLGRKPNVIRGRLLTLARHQSRAEALA